MLPLIDEPAQKNL